MTVLDFLGQLLAEGPVRLGQVRLCPDYSLCHFEDEGRSDLQPYSDPHDAIEIAKYDDEGKYRPLKTAPNLRHGWQLRFTDLKAVQLALDFLYPAALGSSLAHRQSRLTAIPLRETLSRQTGMYAITKKITDAQAEAVIGHLCRPGCLRHVLWPIGNGNQAAFGRSAAGDEISIFCMEACNLFVAACREEVKKNQSSSGSM